MCNEKTAALEATVAKLEKRVESLEKEIESLKRRSVTYTELDRMLRAVVSGLQSSIANGQGRLPQNKSTP